MSIELLITSDDFGMSHSINQAIIHSAKLGSIQSSNIMVPTPWARQATQLSIENQFKVGIHLTHTCEWDHYLWRPISRSESLMDH